MLLWLDLWSFPYFPLVWPFLLRGSVLKQVLAWVWILDSMQATGDTSEEGGPHDGEVRFQQNAIRDIPHTYIWFPMVVACLRINASDLPTCDAKPFQGYRMQVVMASVNHLRYGG